MQHFPSVFILAIDCVMLSATWITDVLYFAFELHFHGHILQKGTLVQRL